MSEADRAILRRQLVRDEGVRLKPYLDTIAHITIGVGRNLSANGITHEEAQLMLEHDIDQCEKQMRFLLPWAEKLDPVRYRVLMNMGFNLGIEGLLAFKNMLACLKVGEYTSAALNMLDSRWAEQVGARATRLAEAMRTGVELP